MGRGTGRGKKEKNLRSLLKRTREGLAEGSSRNGKKCHISERERERQRDRKRGRLTGNKRK